MQSEMTSTELGTLLNKAIAREMRVSIQYMLQHAIWNAKEPAKHVSDLSSKQNKFVSSHSSVWLPGSTLKKIAIAEMRHAEAITERVVRIGGEPTTQPDSISVGNTLTEILEIDREQEHSAIELYEKIIQVATRDNDTVTLNLFKRIISDERNHHKTFSSLLEKH